MIIKDESDSHNQLTDTPLKQKKELNSKESGPLTEHYQVKGFSGVDDSKKTQDYNIY